MTNTMTMATQWWRLGAQLNAYNLPRTQVAQLAAQMIAAARQFDSVTRPFHVKPGEELTALGWNHLRSEADRLWRTETFTPGESVRDDDGAPRGVSPFSDSVATEGYHPGLFERLRQWVHELIERRIFDRPDDLLELLFAIASSTSAPELSTSSEVGDLMARLVRAEPGERVLCAFSGAAEAALWVARHGHRVVLEIPDREAAAFWASLAAAADLPVSVLAVDPFEILFAGWGQSERDFDVVIAAPPFGLKVTHQVPPGSGLGLPPRRAKRGG